MKLKALVYQQKEWNPLQLSTDFPVFPVENITEEALAVWKLHAEEVLLITPTDAGIQAAVRAHMAVAAYADPAFPEQSYAGAWMVIEGFEEVDDEFLERIFQRCHGQPWEIARTKRCVIRELSLEDLPALEKLYQKEGVTWRLDADGERIPGFIEPLFAKEKEKKYQQAYITNMYGYYGYGMWLVFDKASGELIGRAGLGRIDSPQPLVFFLIEREKPERKQGHHKCEQEDHCRQDDVPAGKFFECHCSFPPVPAFSFYPIIRNPGAKVNHPPRKFTKVCNNGKSPVVSTNHRAFSWRSRRDLNPRAVV